MFEEDESKMSSSGGGEEVKANVDRDISRCAMGTADGPCIRYKHISQQAR